MTEVCWILRDPMPTRSLTLIPPEAKVCMCLCARAKIRVSTLSGNILSKNHFPVQCALFMPDNSEPSPEDNRSLLFVEASPGPTQRVIDTNRRHVSGHQLISIKDISVHGIRLNY
ncbi:hypothetical protein KIL84_023042 [Mauremys mutica]|uniref:Uncharacterized protein n=1 Tax=Mauremys mutica TaxID=74926 RepID=A0A9D3WRX1_9SAUR|nr:hypothetical protein KIL84_023042 [Mauremys mutica]